MVYDFVLKWKCENLHIDTIHLHETLFLLYDSVRNQTSNLPFTIPALYWLANPSGYAIWWISKPVTIIDGPHLFEPSYLAPWVLLMVAAAFCLPTSGFTSLLPVSPHYSRCDAQRRGWLRRTWSVPWRLNLIARQNDWLFTLSLFVFLSNQFLFLSS